ncbi:hypothetical protein ABT392_22075 [Paucibacter sp. JuS9]|uniref:hypothetical protein n=1 Tax=Paucibacter sp. JuS9 TaxID=3228748 RepID=UPI0037567FEC
MPVDQFSEQIQKTGFVLENVIAQQLKAARWTVISNRYYVDDAEESVREIDLVAYQVTRVQHFDVYTALLISCKKSDANAWALLCREIDLKDPNSNWQPLHAWSNDKAVTFQLAKSDSARLYHEAISPSKVGDALRTPAVDVFAFQEMSKASGAPQNDKAIFSATTSLMKAQSYELDALPQRRTNPAVYQFNLLSVVDSDLIRLFFDGTSIETQPVEQEHYIARYIIKKQATFSRIRFMRAAAFAALLPEYSSLHLENCRWFDAQCDEFYVDIVKDAKRAATLIIDFRNEVRWVIRWALIEKKLPAPDIDKLDFYWSDRSQQIQIYGPFGSAGAQALNDDQKVKGKVAAALKNVYRYVGAFEFDDDDIPF